jgi:hypothetical protein
MDDSYDLNSIFSAIEDINNNKKKKITSLDSNNFDKMKEITTPNAEILPITEKLILEAENYSNLLKKKNSVLSTTTKDTLDPPATNKDILILSNQYEYNEQNLETINLEKIKQNVIDDLYSSLSNKVKRNTLKIIFDLHLKINELEKKLKTLSINKTEEDYIQNSYVINPNNSKEKSSVNDEHLINEDYLVEGESFLINEKKNYSEKVIKTLQFQESLIKDFKKNEEKLRLKIVEIEQDFIILNNKKNNITQNPTSEKKENMYKQTALKKESELIFYRENYERLIIENNDIKKKLSNSKQQIIGFEQNVKELEDAFENFNNILSKNSIIKISQPSSKDPLILISSKEELEELEHPIIYNDDKNPKKK